ncbi:putative Sin3 binding protein-domain-containing protein [Diplogelasinospora grovesii]|uniref:Sin3 binding protein-domain-containing protein n=1 Tax=Diplogelasinospora grovesii TaxID=303347 RepID=A0AAN6NF52_9PEZI|nr:putative Sin3 binding protein-domain-containing protein [Diplogelasinospora grovesii]
MATMMASAVRDIPSTSGRDNLTAVAVRSVPVATHHHPKPLPTPPNSISPALPPHGLKAQLMQQRAAKLEPIDSDLDLQDGQDDHDHGPAGLASPPYDSAGAISPAMLAKFHLPEILLNHGPLAIRHIMGYLTTSVPGFAGIPPAKARRLVVGALEGRGSENGGGLDGDVEFEKVGWGRWDARRRGQPSRRDASTSAHCAGSPSGGIPISKGWSAAATARPRLGKFGSTSSAGGGSSAAFSHDDFRDCHDMTMLDHEADKMSMDGSASASCSEAPDDDDVEMGDDPEDATDDEDWAAVGAAALRASSYQAQVHQHFPNSFNNNKNNNVYTSSGGGPRSFSASTGMARAPSFQFGNFDFSSSALAVTSDAQEREAVEALLRLGSV